jgi:hypothetical protein
MDFVDELLAITARARRVRRRAIVPASLIDR